MKAFKSKLEANNPMCLFLCHLESGFKQAEDKVAELSDVEGCEEGFFTTSVTI